MLAILEFAMSLRLGCGGCGLLGVCGVFILVLLFWVCVVWVGGCVTVVWVDGFGSVCGLLRAVVVFWCFLAFGFWWLGI